MTCYTCGNSIYIHSNAQFVPACTCIDNILTINTYYNVLRVTVQGGGGGGWLPWQFLAKL